jgi:hypothetical protein
MSDTSPTDSITVCNSTNEEACRTNGNELGYNLYQNLGGPGTGNRGPFTNIPNFIWSGAEFSAGSSAWFLRADNGNQNNDNKDNQNYVWAVRPGE